LSLPFLLTRKKKKKGERGGSRGGEGIYVNQQVCKVSGERRKENHEWIIDSLRLC